MKLTKQDHSNLLFGVIILLGICLTSCHIPVDEALGPYKLADRKPDRSEMIGTWVIDQETIEDMRFRGRYEVVRPTELVLRADDSYEITNMPDWYQNPMGESHGGFVNLTGKWSLTENNGFWRVRLAATDARAPQVDLREPRYSSQPRYLLEVVLGDPDENEAMRFRKQ